MGGVGRCHDRACASTRDEHPAPGTGHRGAGSNHKNRPLDECEPAGHGIGRSRGGLTTKDPSCRGRAGKTVGDRGHRGTTQRRGDVGRGSGRDTGTAAGSGPDPTGCGDRGPGLLHWCDPGRVASTPDHGCDPGQDRRGSCPETAWQCWWAADRFRCGGLQGPQRG